LVVRRSGQRWYQVVYRTFYALGLRIWERQRPPTELVDLVEGGSCLPPGRALDVGCGSGVDSVYLAQHGWDVTGIDMAPQAIALARKRSAAAGVGPRFVQGEVTALQELGVGDGYALILDFGCFHTLPEDQRDAYVDSISAAAAPGARLLVFGFGKPPKYAPMAAGISTTEVQRRFVGPRWTLLRAHRATSDAIEVAGARVDRSFELWCFQLQRRQLVSAPA
jgi:SAM-dependent methyltransferase